MEFTNNLRVLLTTWLTLVIAALVAPSYAYAEVPDVRGSWAELQVQTAVTDVPILGELRSRTISLLTVEVEQNGQDLELRYSLCDLKIQTPTAKIRTIIPKALIAAIGSFRLKSKLIKRDEGWTFYQSPAMTVLGAKLTNSWEDSLPQSTEDPRVFDSDRDGKPGVTVKVVGLISGSIYVAQRGWTELTGKLTPKGISGQVRWQMSQTILGATSVFLKTDPKARPDPAPAASYFQLVRIPKNTSCKDLKRKQASFFPELR